MSNHDARADKPSRRSFLKLTAAAMADSVPLGDRPLAQATSAVGQDINSPAAAIATLYNKHGIPPLTARADGARDLANALNLAEPRPTSDWPETTPQYVPPNPEAGGPFSQAAGMTPLSPPGMALMGMLVKNVGFPTDEIPKTCDGAYTLLHRLGPGLFG